MSDSLELRSVATLQAIDRFAQGERGVPTNFERAKMMLDQMGPQLADGGAGAVASLKRLSGDYAGLTNGGIPPIDYSSPDTHLAYVYSYLVSNASLIYQALRGCHADARAKFGRPVVNIVAVGGGPASEIIGVFKFIEQVAVQPVHINLTILDREPTWAAVWPVAVATAPPGVTVAVHYAPFTFHELPPPALPAAITTADIITFSFTLSEAWRYNQGGVVSQRLGLITGAAPAGSIILYSDNAGPNFDPQIERDLLTRPLVRPLFRERLGHFIGSDEESSVLGEYRKFFSRSPRWTGDATIAAVEKI